VLQESLNVFERKGLSKIFGPIQRGEMWRARHNTELYEECREPDITMMMKIARLRWGRHLIRMTATCQEEL